MSGARLNALDMVLALQEFLQDLLRFSGAWESGGVNATTIIGLYIYICIHIYIYIREL